MKNYHKERFFARKNRIEKAKKLCYNDKNARQFGRINRYNSEEGYSDDRRGI